MISALFTYIIVRELFYHYTTQKLINKIMSRNYHEFQLAERSGKIDSQPSFKAHEEEGEPEDMGVVTGIF